MIEKKFVIKNKLGLHARPAALFVQLTTRFNSKVRVIRQGQEVDGKSIMGLMILAAEQGSTITVIADGDDEQQVVDELAVLFDKNFEED
ncbi:MAG: HPr family phosphocarrier protein [Elusimicrobia bacterium]|nr:HPr family phosphocarrier protein [Elusimicrobiota bacterium]MBD3411798.1 HPr family phosphocarrier protein [Elusimicrobiota bacterium]